MNIRKRISVLLCAGIVSCMVIGPVVSQDEQGGGRRGQRGGGQRGGFGQGGGQRGGQRGFGFGGFGQRGGGGTQTIFTVLKNDNVKKELNVSDDESAFIKIIEDGMGEKREEFMGPIQDKMREKMQEIREGGGDGEAMREAFNDLRGEMEKANAEYTKSVMKDLSEVLGDRMARAEQISWQVEVQWNGMGAIFGNATLAEKLGITDTQKTEYQDASREIMMEAFGGGRGGFGQGGGRRGRPGQDQGGDNNQAENNQEDRETRMQKMRDDVAKLANEYLTDAQKKKWGEIIGEKISYEVERPQRGGQRRGGRPDGNRGDA